MRDVDADFITHFVTAPGSGMTTVQDLKDKRIALGHRGSAQAGLLAYYFLQQLGLDPTQDLAACTFYDERPAGAPSDEQDVIQRVCQGEYDAGAVTQRTLDTLQAAGTLQPERLRILWSSPGYSHCCFTAHNDMAPALVEQITRAFLTITADDSAGKAVLEGEKCAAFIPGTTRGWEMLEEAARRIGIF
jgi:phosphonate transport system substrate-binding protein